MIMCWFSKTTGCILFKPEDVLAYCLNVLMQQQLQPQVMQARFSRVLHASIVDARFIGFLGFYYRNHCVLVNNLI